MFTTPARALIADALALLLPRVCLSCECLLPYRSSAFVCSACWGRVRPLPPSQCPRCGQPGHRTPCHFCAQLAPVVTEARSYCWASDPVAERALYALKYHGWPRIGAEIGERLAGLRYSPSVEARSRVVMPVPLAPARERERGFNQAAVLAAALAQVWQCGLATDVLFRARETPSQTRLTPVQRLANVANAFRIDHLAARRIAPHVVVLVDDVLTTGATLNACSRELVQAGVTTICYLTFARARDPRDARRDPGQNSHEHPRRD